VSAPLEVFVDGAPVSGKAGQSLGALLLAAGRAELRRSPGGGPRGLYCGIGICQECRVRVEGRGTVRACVTPAEPGMRVTLGHP
jgi:D-hydroxyproline dehydrogenase subunit gamma